MTIDEVEDALISYIGASTHARLILSQLRGADITSLDVQRALCEVLNVESTHPNELLGRRLTSEQIVSLLRTFDFRQFHPEVLAEIELEEGVLPPSFIRLLTEKTVKVKGEVWRIHKNDADQFPSVPHAHNYDAGITLHLGNGQLFNANRQNVGNIGPKKLEVIRGKLDGFSLPPLDI